MTAKLLNLNGQAAGLVCAQFVGGQNAASVSLSFLGPEIESLRSWPTNPLVNVGRRFDIWLFSFLNLGSSRLALGQTAKL